MKTVEYRVRKVERFIVTRWHHESDERGESGGCIGYGEFDTIAEANEVAEALYQRAQTLPSSAPDDVFKLEQYRWDLPPSEVGALP